MTIYDEIILCWINDFLLDFLGFLAKADPFFFGKNLIFPSEFLGRIILAI